MLNFTKLFDRTRPRPIKIEICSGTGHWVSQQAAADPGSDWVALELRRDRVHRIFRSIAQGVDNLAVLGGDASKILPAWIPDASVDLMAINFPEPPAWHGGGDSTAHLLTPQFFEELRRVLRGPMTILTDNLKYLRNLAASASASGFRDPKRTENPIATIDGIGIYFGQPDASLGYIVSANSYFDQLWAKNAKKRQKRYFVSVV